MTKPNTALRDKIIEILEDFAESLADAKEEDSMAKIIEVVTQSVNESTNQILKIIQDNQEPKQAINHETESASDES